MKKECIGVIVVAAGNGSRMKADCPKQFIEVEGRPILSYTLKAFQESDVDEIVIVTSEEHIDYVKHDIVERYQFTKVSRVVKGGHERYLSVYEGLKAMDNADYVMVHDGARPFVRVSMINRMIAEVKEEDAIVAAVKTKDTVKIVDENGYVSSTPNRNYVWNIQTPQAFTYKLLKTSYDKIVSEGYEGATDDAMVVELASNQKIKVVEGDYRNIKITTPEDLRADLFAEILGFWNW